LRLASTTWFVYRRDSRIARLEKIMVVARLAVSGLGLLAVLVGLLWIGQGTGLFPYPASSFMINQSPWILRGAVVLLAGLAMLWAGRRFIR
jgi:hypothetical protein